MDKICKICAKDPTSHSFRKVGEKRGISIFYMCPSQATQYKDTEGILNHFNKALELNHPKKWACIIDGEGFDIRHAAETDTGRGLLDLMMNKHSDSLVNVKLINPSWHMKGVLTIAESLFTPSFIEKLQVLDDKVHSILEFI
jgi:hypothetical protein